MNTQSTFDPKHDLYLMKDPRLESAVEVALDLGMPLLVTGEPGTGKTRLGIHIAEQVIKSGDPLIFSTKAGSNGKSLFYRYNALTHFRDSQMGKEDLNPMNYVSFEPLGRAIVESAHKRHVVIIDEIDKAPRDFANDVLYEFEEMAFRVEEASIAEVKAWAKNQKESITVDDQGFIRFAGKTNQRPFLLITSNSEKSLPDAFLRRCVYYNIRFPDEELLTEIVRAKIPLEPAFADEMLPAAVEYFLEIREKKLRKPPATAEFLAWVHLLNREQINVAVNRRRGANKALREELYRTLSVLLKTQSDRERLEEELARI
jgi:MoxR-like ATPase